MPREELDVRWPLKGDRRMESNRPDESSSPTGSERLAVDSIFRSDAARRQALTENLKPLRAESGAIAARVDSAFENFDLNQASPLEGARPQRCQRSKTDPLGTVENYSGSFAGPIWR
jgi:hypothetical protein